MISGLMLAAVMGAGPTVSVQFEGPMNLALKEIATRGQLNLLVAGELTQPVQVSLSNVTADEAIESVAKAYGLELRREGKMIIVRPSVAAPVAAAATPAPTPARRPVP